MIRLKESSMFKYRPGFIADNWLETVLYFPDALGRTGYDAFREHDIELVTNTSHADVGFAKGISKVKGVPRKKCILWKGEPPIYDVFFGPFLRNKSYLKEHLAVMSYYKENGSIHANGPQNGFSFYKQYFDGNDRNFLCMILTNKTFSTFLNSLIFWDTKEHCLMKYREFMDRKFCDLLGEKKYVTYGRGWDERCFRGSLPNWNDMYKVLAQHRFAFVPENSSYPGYVSDKIINAMCCGCIPIYEGAPDVDEFIPRNCFIHARKYPPKELIERLNHISFSEYQRFRNNIRKFVTTEQSDMYSSYKFCEKIANIIEERL